MVLVKKIKTKKKKAWYARKYSTEDLAWKAWEAAKYLKGIINSEMYHMVNASAASVDTTGTVVSLCNIAQGDDISGRTGDSIFVKYLQSRFIVTKHASATFTSVSIFFVIDNQQVADTAPTITDVLQSADPLSGLNLSKHKRCRVLARYNFMLDANDVSKEFKLNKALKHHVFFNGTASTDIQKGGIYMMAISNEASNTPTIIYNDRISYYDN